MEVILEPSAAMSLKELFKRAESEPYDYEGASLWPSLRTVAQEAEETFFSTPLGCRDVSESHAARWAAALEDLCPLSLEGNDFPREWFYRSWYRYMVVASKRIGSELKLAIGEEAQEYLTSELRTMLERDVEDRLAAIGYEDSAGSPNERTRSTP